MREWNGCKTDMNFSLIIPGYNEACNLPAFFSAATSCFDRIGIEYELIFVNDGSTDDTAEVLEREIASYRAAGGGRATIKVVEFSRNFGKEAALYAGLERAIGDCIGFIDADMQQDPAISLKMFRFLEEHPSYDCVAAVQDARKESRPLRVCKKLFYRVFNDMSDTRIIADVSDFRVFRRPVAKALLSMHEHFRFSKGLFAWVGFRTYVIPYQVHKRLSGASKWTLRSLVSYGWNGVLAFSTWPLKLIMYTGVILALASLLFLGWDVYDKIAFNNDLPINQILLYVTLLLGGIQMFVLGIFGEYMARAYIETKRRPLYIERDAYVSFADFSDRDVRAEEVIERPLRNRGDTSAISEKGTVPEASPVEPEKDASVVPLPNFTVSDVKDDRCR